jgi:hypothetical protein
MIVIFNEEDIKEILVKELNKKKYNIHTEQIDLNLISKDISPQKSVRASINLNENLESKLKYSPSHHNILIALTKEEEELAASLELDALAKKFHTDKSSGGHFYTQYYEQILQSKKDNVKSLLEIGIGGGGSLKVWATYFPNAQIYALDIHKYKSEIKRIQAFQFNQNNKNKLIETFKYKTFDIIIDDGGHNGSDILISLDILFNYLINGGYYIIEDMSCNKMDTTLKNSLQQYQDACKVWEKSFCGKVMQWIIDNNNQINSVQVFLDKRAKTKESGQCIIFIQKS